MILEKVGSFGPGPFRAKFFGSKYERVASEALVQKRLHFPHCSVQVLVIVSLWICQEVGHECWKSNLDEAFLRRAPPSIPLLPQPLSRMLNRHMISRTVAYPSTNPKCFLGQP